MGQPASKPESDALFRNDVTSLFSRCGEYTAGSGSYQEVVRNDAAYGAACRWPLLAEIQGMEVDADVNQTGLFA